MRPAVILGGTGSAISLTRSLGRIGVPVDVLGAEASSLAHASRYCRRFVSLGDHEGIGDAWLDWLEREGPDGAVLLPAGDEGLELIVRARERLEARGFRMPITSGDVSLDMLDKTRTYQLARAAGVACPRTWNVADAADVAALDADVPFPCALKPLHSHLWAKHFSVKVLVARDRRELADHLAAVGAHGLQVLVTEIVPGPDELVWDYRTYLDEAGQPLFGLTTQRLRCHPVHFGNNCYLRTRDDAEVAQAGLAFLHGVGLRGLADVEFKRDPRDGVLKLIECNHRFFGAQELLRRAGIDVAVAVYHHAGGGAWPPMRQRSGDVRLWFPLKDLHAARALRAERQLSWAAWVGSLARPRVYTPVLTRDDLRPTAVAAARKVRGRISRPSRDLRRQHP